MGKGLGSKSVACAVVISMLAAALAVIVAAPSVCAETFQAPFASMSGDVASENQGRSLALLDLNGDGIADLAMGAPYDHPEGRTAAGSVTMYLSDAGTPFSTVKVLNGTHIGDTFGWALADAGDLNGDGYADLAIGAPLADPGGNVDAGNLTIVYGGALFDGTPGTWINSTVPGEELGYALAGGGDINRDSYDDLVAGAPYCTASGMVAAGRAYVYYGGSPMNSIADRTFSGEDAGAHFGWSLSGNGSVDGDTSADIVVGAPDHRVGGAALGAAYVIRNVHKANPGVSLAIGNAAGDKFGYSVAILPDMNGDSYSDVAVGAPYNDDNGSDAGSVSIMFGGFKFNVVTDLTLLGQASDETFGWSVAGGNVRLDDYADVLVGAPNSNITIPSAGRAYLFYGAAAPDADPDIVLAPETGADLFGASVAIGGNATGDVAPEFVVGDPLFTPSGLTSAGKAYVYAGVLVVVPVNPVVNGYVRVPGTAVGLAGFTVLLENGSFSKNTVSAADGYFEIEAVPGTYWLNATRPGYVMNSTEVSLVMDEVESVIIQPLTTPLVNGHVRDNVTDAVIQGATVAIWSGADLVASALTPVNGSFWLYLPDSYVPAVGENVDLILAAWDGSHYSVSANITIMRNETASFELRLDRFPVVTGTVRDAITLSPVRDAVVEASQGGILGSAQSAANGQYTLTAVNASVPGTLFVNLTAIGYFRLTAIVSADRNGSYVQDFFLQIDHVSPTSSLAALSAYTTSEVVSLSATASDANGIEQVGLWYRFGGSGEFVYSGADAEAPYEFEFNATEEMGDGVYEFYCQALDYAGNNESAPAVNDTWTLVDTSIPLVSLEELAEFTMNENFTVNATATDANGVASVSLYLAKNGSAPVLVGTDSAEPYTWTIVGGSWDMEGLYELTATAVDSAGNARAAPATPDASTYMDLTVPELNITLPASNTFTAKTSMTINWTCNDTGSGIMQCKVRIDGGVWINAGYNTTYNFTGLLHGPHTVMVNATDWAGRTTLKDVRFVVDIEPPELTVTAPDEGEIIDSEDVEVVWSAYDPESGVTKYEVAVDGGAFESFGTLTSTELINLEDGPHDVVVRAWDGVGNYKDVTIGFTVDTSGGGGGGIDYLLVALVIVAIVAVIAVAALLMRRKGGSPEELPGKMPPKK